MGLLFGFQDGDNGYRFSFGGAASSNQFTREDGGVTVFKEAANVRTTLSDDDSSFWAIDTPYKVTVSRTGDDLSIKAAVTLY